jgi:hypothetical protein
MMESTIESLCIKHPACKTIISYIHGDGHNIQILLDFFEELTEHFASKSAFRVYLVKITIRMIALMSVMMQLGG